MSGTLAESSFAARAACVLPAVLDAALEAGALLKEHDTKPRSIRRKGRIDLVTETDLAIEELLMRRLRSCLPEAAFVAEESASSLDLPQTCWVIDPVDGTTNFAHGLPITGISIGLWHEGEALLGVVNVPLLNECYSAAAGRGAFCNGMPIGVSSAGSLEEALVATGFPYSIEADLSEVMGRMQKVLPKVQGVRRCGAASVDLAWVARGRFDAFYENRLKPWDMAAGYLLVREAGGCATRFDGGPFSLGGGEILASNGKVHEAMAALLGA